MPANLNRKQQREIKAVVERAKKDNGIPQTAQQSIPFQRMFPDGICRVTDSYYTKTIQFQDINYQLAQQEDKTAIFDEWCSFLNFFDSSIHFELSFMNLSTDAESFEKSIRIPFKKDSFNPVRAEYSQMLKKQLAQGNNGLTKTKYLTFGIEAESMRQAKPRLNHIENDLLNNFRRLGVIATTMNGKERLHLMHSMFHMGDNDKFFFDWKYLVESGLSVKDFIAPTAFAFKTNRTFQMGSIFGSMSYLAITASDLSDRMLADFLDMESTQIVTMHIQSVDQTAAIKTIKRIITELDRSKIEEQKKAVRSGYDMDIIPSDLATYGKDAKSLLKELQSQNERMFMVTFLVLNTGRTEQELENNVFQAQSIAQKHNCNLRRLDFQQESGLMSSLPLAQNLIEIRRGLTTSSTAIFVPFTTQELFQNGGETLYYGLNALSNNLIMVDRKKLKNPNGLILGTPGSGKSFSAKREITNAFLVTDDDIIICDPEAEYAALVHKFIAQFLVQILFAGHAQLIADRLFLTDLHLDTGVAVAVFLTGNHADLYGISPGGDRLYKGRRVLQLHQRIAGENLPGGEMDGTDVQYIHRHVPNHFLCEMGLQVIFTGQFILDCFVFVQPFSCRHISVLLLILFLDIRAL